MLCSYGCGQEALYQLKNGKLCCSECANSCPVNRRKISASNKKSQNRPETKLRKSESIKESWKDPESRNNHFIASNKPEAKRKHQVATKEAMCRSAVKEKKIETFLERYGVRYAGQLEKVREASKQRLLSWQSEYMNMFPRDEDKLKKLYETTRQRMIGENNPLWNPNREEVFTPYTEKFFDKEYREQIKREQNNLDPVTYQLLTEAQLHHIDYNKQNDSRENLIWLNLSTHMKTNGGRRNKENWQKTLQKINSKISRVE